MNKKQKIILAALAVVLVSAVIILSFIFANGIKGYEETGMNVNDLFEDEFGLPVNYTGIAVDSDENIYLAYLNGNIDVINVNGEKIRDIKIDSISGGFEIDIVNDRINISSGTNYYVTDLYGKKLNVTMSADDKQKLRIKAMHAEAESGTVYYLSNNHVFRENSETGKLEMVY